MTDTIRELRDPSGAPVAEADDGSANGAKSGLLRALGVLRLIADHAPDTLGVSTIARELELPKSVAHRILKEFTTASFLVFDGDSKQYRLGPATLTLGLAALRSLDLPRMARPHLEQLVRATGETATLSVRQGWRRVYIDQVLSRHEVRMSVTLGVSYPLHAGSSSKVILAHLSDTEIDEFFAEVATLERLTPATITDVRTLRAVLDRVRRVGFAVSGGERQVGAGSVASPIFQASGEVFGSISLCGPRDRFDAVAIDKYAPLVSDTAARISAELGHRRTDRAEASA